MRVTTKIVFDAAGNVLEHEWYEYDGPVAECKKGRETVEKAGQNANDLTALSTDYAKQNRQKQLGYADSVDPFAKSLVPDAGGGLSPYVKAQFDQQKRNIAKTYGDTAAVGLKSLQSRGMGGAPSGLTSSIYNTAGRNAGEAETNAYADAQGRTLGAGLEGVKALQGQEGVFDPNKDISSALGGTQAATNAGATRSQMGSTLGDIGAGLGAVAGIATGVGGLGTALKGVKKGWSSSGGGGA